MPTQPASNHLRAHRKRLGLSQEDLVFLLGCPSRTKVPVDKRLQRPPNLATVFAFEVIVGVPARTLFAGVYLSAERDVVRRIETLLRRLAGFPDSPQVRRRIVALNAILGTIADGDNGVRHDGP